MKPERLSERSSAEDQRHRGAQIEQSNDQKGTNGTVNCGKSPFINGRALKGLSPLVRRSTASALRRVIRITPEHLSIPKGGKAILAELAWPNDESRRADFLQRRALPRYGLSRKQLAELNDAGGCKIWLQVERWGISGAAQVAWLLEPYIDPMTERERERARRRDALNLIADGRILRELDERAARRKGPLKGHATQSAARRDREAEIRRDASELRATDTNKSKTALADILSRRYNDGGTKYGRSKTAILRAAGDLLEKKRSKG